MNTALSWIKAYVPELECTDQEYCDAMTLSGTKVEGYERRDRNLEKILVGQVLSIERHPDADKLIVCQVDIGGETIQIVTGAQNVTVGCKVPVVLDGGKVAGGHDGGPLPQDGIKIKAGKLRGVPSNGMMCSIEELGSDRNMYPEAPQEGIYIFGEDVPVGADAVELLLGEGRLPTALWCASDYMAVGAMHALRLRGLSIPGDISVMGHDDLYFARYPDISLTTLHTPMEELGRACGISVGAAVAAMVTD